MNKSVSVPSGPLSLRNGLLIFGIVCLVTLLMFLHSPHLSAILNVSTSVISSTLHRFMRAGIVSLTFVLFMFLFYFIFIFLGRLLVLYFSFVAPAVCYLFFLHVVLCCMCSLLINDDDDEVFELVTLQCICEQHKNCLTSSEAVVGLLRYIERPDAWTSLT